MTRKSRSANRRNGAGPDLATDVTPMSDHAHADLPWRWMMAVSIVFLVLAGLFNAVSPLAVVATRSLPANPDEQVHVFYVEKLAGGHLPVFTPGGGNYEAHQPPLYYAICAPVYMATRSLSPETQAKMLRLVSTLIGLALVWVTFFAVRELFPNDPMTALFAAMFVALLPMNVSLAASVSNDSLTNLVMGLGLWQLARIAVNARAWNDRTKWGTQALVLGAIMGAGIWTKTSTLLLLPVTVVVLSILAVRQPKSRRPALATMAMACVGGLVIGLPWMVRNTMLYGDPVAQHIFMTAFKNTAHPEQMMPAFHCDSPHAEAICHGHHPVDVLFVLGSVCVDVAFPPDINLWHAWPSVWRAWVMASCGSGARAARLTRHGRRCSVVRAR